MNDIKSENVVRQDMIQKQIDKERLSWIEEMMIKEWTPLPYDGGNIKAFTSIKINILNPEEKKSVMSHSK